MQRPDAGEDPEAHVEGEEHPRLQRRIELLASIVRNENDVLARRDVEREDPDEDER